MKLTLLGTGTPSPSLKRASSGYLIEVGDDVIVMDHGPGSHHRLLQTGKQAVDVTHMLFSHLHYDHCADFVRLFLTRWDMGADRIPELKVYGPPHIRRMIDLMFGDEQAAFGPDINSRIRHQGSIDIFVARGGKPPRKWPKPEVSEIHPKDTIKGKDWTVTVGAASHVQPYLECYGYRLECAEGSICYSGDSGGVAPGLTDLIAGQVSLMFPAISAGLPQVQSGRLRALAITSQKRSSAATELPTMDESGLKGYEVYSWIGIMGPAGLQKPVIDRWHADVLRALAEADIRKRFAALGIDIIGNSPDEFARIMQSDLVKFDKLVKASGARVD